MKMLLYPAVEPERLAAIQQASGSMVVTNASTAEQALVEIVDADAFFGRLTPNLLDAARKLSWVQSPTASLEHYLFPELIAHPCRLSNMRGLFSDVIADHVLGYVLCFARNLHHYIRRQQHSRWAPVGDESVTEQPFMTGPSHVTAIDLAHMHLSDATLGVVGVGQIGSEICRRAAAFNMRILGVDPHCRRVEDAVDEVWPVERLNDLLNQSDFVVIAAPHTPQTEKLFNAERLRHMKRSAYLINIGRGVIVDLQALTEALRHGIIAGAGLDVFEIEPLPASHPLWQMENVIITPHVAAASTHIAERHLATLLDNIRRFVNGQEPATLVDKSRWY